MGKNWYTEGKARYGSIINLPNGGGYYYTRDAFTRTVKFLSGCAENIILLGHIKDVQLDKDNNQVSASELDLTGKVKRITAAKSDAIGYLYRKDNKDILSFKTNDTIVCGARPAHLRNQEIVLGEEIDGKLVTYWNKIYK